MLAKRSTSPAPMQARPTPNLRLPLLRPLLAPRKPSTRSKSSSPMKNQRKSHGIRLYFHNCVLECTTILHNETIFKISQTLVNISVWGISHYLLCISKKVACSNWDWRALLRVNLIEFYSNRIPWDNFIRLKASSATKCLYVPLTCSESATVSMR